MRVRRTAPWRTVLLVLLFSLSAIFLIYSLGDRVHRYFRGVKPGVTLEGIAMERLLAGEVREKVEQMRAAVEIAPRNARYDRKTGNVAQEVPGTAIALEATVREVMGAEKNQQLKLTLISLEPELTAEHFQSITRKITSFSTSGGGSAGRTDNLYTAAKYMDGTVLAPGDVFSFNKATGPRTFERGYSMAPVVGGVGIGGGVCQVATTLYNVALRAGLEIIERHRHSVPVGYVPAGRDATVTNYIDLKFRNSTDGFLKIRSGAGGGHVWVQLWGQQLDKDAPGK